MLDQILFYTLLGIIAGTITGLTPGLHINTIAVILLSLYFKYLPDPIIISSFIIGMSVTHTFTDFIPSVFLGAPDEKTAASMLPSHSLMKEGRGYEAIVLSIAGGLGGIIILIISIPFMFNLIPNIYTSIRPVIGTILILSMCFIIYTINPKKRTISTILLIYSGLLGYLVLNFNHINSNYLLLPLFSGMFGISGMLETMKDKNSIPKQITSFQIEFKKTLKESSQGFFGGIVAGLLPGFGSSNSILLIHSLRKESSREDFITSSGTIGTIDIIISFIALYLIGNARSGSSVVISHITGSINRSEIFLFIFICIFSAGIAAIITLFLGKRMSTIFHNINSKKLSITLIILITAITIYFTGLYGLLILITSTATGTLAFRLDLRKSLLLGCLIIPTIIFFIL